MKQHLRITVPTLVGTDTPQREIARRTGVDRKTIRTYARAMAMANSPGVATGFSGAAEQIPPPRPPAPADAPIECAPAAAICAASACEPHRAWIEAQLALGRNAVSIYQELVDTRDFGHAYNSVKRFVASIRKREPERFDVLEFLPGEEAQVDYGQGALTQIQPGKYKRPYLFVMTLKYSGKSFRKTVWKTSQEAWSRLHEEAFLEPVASLATTLSRTAGKTRTGPAAHNASVLFHTSTTRCNRAYDTRHSPSGQATLAVLGFMRTIVPICWIRSRLSMPTVSPGWKSARVSVVRAAFAGAVGSPLTTKAAYSTHTWPPTSRWMST